MVGKSPSLSSRIQIIAVNNKNHETASARQTCLNHRMSFSSGYFEKYFSIKFIITKI